MFTVREVYAQMVAAGTGYAESTVFKTMQRMKEAPKRPPTVQVALLDRGDVATGVLHDADALVPHRRPFGVTGMEW